MLSVHLANIKSSGVYRFVFDKSEIPSQAAPQTMRLVVGYSEKGPFNTVTYVRNSAEFIQIYGNISKKLEKYGSYFHRMALQCLSKGPILCLNIKKVESSEEVEYAKFNVYNNAHPAVSNSKLSVGDIYDQTRMWSLSPETMFENIKGDDAKYINISSTDTLKNSCTIFMRPSYAKGYDVTLMEWYNTYFGGEYPEYLEGNLDALVSDFLVDIYVFRGEILKNDAFSEYFADGAVKDTILNSYGEKIDGLQALSEKEGSGFLVKYTGSLLPYFKNIDGSWMSIDLVFNNDVNIHNLMMYLDESQLDANNIANLQLCGVDLIGDTLPNGKLNTSVCTIDGIKYNMGVWKANTNNGAWERDGSRSNDDYYGDIAVDVFAGFTQDSTEVSTLFFTRTTDKTVFYSAKQPPMAVGDKFIANSAADKDFAIIESIIEKKGTDENSTTDDYYEIRFDVAPKEFADGDTLNIVRYNSKLTIHGNHCGLYIKGYTVGNTKPVNTSAKGKADWINAKLSVLKDKGIREALTNGVDVDYRYIVDTFEGFPERELRSQLSSLAKEKGNAFVISNFPSMKTFAKDDAFKNNTSNVFNTKFIAAGRNKSNTTSSTEITMPSDLNGASFIAFYTPLKFSDSGIRIDVPSAALVSNNFMDKYTSRQPYYVVAGPSYGKMDYEGLIGPDFNFTREDLDNLEPMGVNCMVYKPQRGTFINSNQTAKQNPVTGLSKVNIRELVIYLQDAISDMLQGYQWELNTQTLRSNIKTKADIICEAVRSNGGLYAYSNVCDDVNNTPEVIDNEMVVLSTSIEPAKGAGKMVHELTIYRTGGMSSIIR